MDKELIAEIRSFNRYYTIILGLLEKHLHHSGHSLVEARIIFELNRHGKMTSSELIEILNLDKGYLSRVLKKLHGKALVKKTNCEQDKRQTFLSLTREGAQEFKKLNKASDAQIELLTKKLTENNLNALVSHMNAIKELLSAK